MFQFMRSWLKEVNLTKQINLLLGVLFVGGILVSSITIGIILNQNAQGQITTEASGLLQTINSVRQYTDAQITPELQERLNEEFLPQIIPSYAAREVFEKLRTDSKWQDYFFKDATLNPTNLRDKADEFETQLTQKMLDNPNLKQLTGFRSTPSGELFYIAQPIIVTQPNCLQCHSTPEAAPKSMIERYGTANGFNWSLNKVLGVTMIYVPASKLFQTAQQSFVIVVGIVVSILAITLLLVNSWLTRSVVRPLKRMTKVAEAISIGDLQAEFEQRSADEVGQLSQAFTRMKTSLALAMQRLERYRKST